MNHDHPHALRYHVSPEEYRAALIKDQLTARRLAMVIVLGNGAFWCLAGLAAVVGGY